MNERDRQTDTAWRHRPCLCIASRGKKHRHTMAINAEDDWSYKTARDFRCTGILSEDIHGHSRKGNRIWPTNSWHCIKRWYSLLSSCRPRMTWIQYLLVGLLLYVLRWWLLTPHFRSFWTNIHVAVRSKVDVSAVRYVDLVTLTFDL